MKAITINTTAGNKTVVAEVFGNLAVHEVKWWPGWRVTHVPTGYAIVIGIAENGDAIACAEQLNALHTWDFVCAEQGAVPIIGEEIAKRVHEIVRPVRRHCGAPAVIAFLRRIFRRRPPPLALRPLQRINERR